MLLLDAFCGGGGAGYGYHLAGFDVVGVDHKNQPEYPFPFFKADALVFIERYGKYFDVIHASPPCQLFSSITAGAKSQHRHQDWLTPTRTLLESLGVPFIIENVPGSPIREDITLCGTMFGLNIIRHRHFECSFYVEQTLHCNHTKPVVKHGRRPDLDKQYHGITGHFSGVSEARRAMGINWLGQLGLAQAIPPAYTEYIGNQIYSDKTNWHDNYAPIN